MSAHILTVAELDAAPWASCGPASLAALLGRSLAEVYDAFPAQKPGRTWTTLGHMRQALNLLGQVWAPTDPAPQIEGFLPMTWPSRGLALIQFRGSWDKAPLGAQLQRTHWIAVAPARHPVGDGRLSMPGVFDVNAVGAGGCVHGWILREEWEQNVAPLIAEDYGRKATGQWWVRAGIEVR